MDKSEVSSSIWQQRSFLTFANPSIFLNFASSLLPIVTRIGSKLWTVSSAIKDEKIDHKAELHNQCQVILETKTFWVFGFIQLLNESSCLTSQAHWCRVFIRWHQLFVYTQYKRFSFHSAITNAFLNQGRCLLSEDNNIPVKRLCALLPSRRANVKM